MPAPPNSAATKTLGVINESLIWSVTKVDDERLKYEITSLALSFKGITTISNLLPYTNIKSLKLDNNNISTIQNISHLSQLESLDLSFNKIETISGLESLSNLSELRLFKNQLKSIDGIDHLKRLKLLNLGKNQIEGQCVEIVRSLRKFKHLRILMLLGNPFATEYSLYRQCTVAHLPQLRYLDYRLALDSEKQSAFEAFEVEVKELMENEAVEEELELKQIEDEKEIEIEKKTNCFSVRNLFGFLINEDLDLKKLSEFEGIDVFLADLQLSLDSLVVNFKEMMISRHGQKSKELDLFSSALKQTSLRNETEALNLVNSFEEQKKNILLKIRELEDLPLEMDHLNNEVIQFMEVNDQLNDQLVELELELVEHNLLIINEFDRNIDQLKKETVEAILSFFNKVRDTISNFSTKVQDIVVKTLDQFANSNGKDQIENEDDSKYSPELKQLLSDKNSLLNMVSNSKDFREMQLDKKEVEVVTSEEQWVTDLVIRIKDEEHARNRQRMDEIWKRKHMVEEEMRSNGFAATGPNYDG
ncbi:hypothetical protein RCL1_004566 [Eukaryota sp. TZLM3-RCL]